MHRFAYIFNHHFLFVPLVFLVFSCDDILRDNPLDPKNPNSYRPTTISIEAFVNTQNDDAFNQYMLSALSIIEQRYPGKVAIAHYHRNVGDTYPDSLAIPANEILYTQYVNNFDGQKGVPDVFINGVAKRIKGASSAETALERLDNALQPMLVENSFYTIEPEVTKSGSKLIVSVVIARLGSELAEDILVRAILVDKRASEPGSPVVKQIEISNLIPSIEPGEQREIQFSDFYLIPGADLSMLFMISSSENYLVEQAIEVGVP